MVTPRVVALATVPMVQMMRIARIEMTMSTASSRLRWMVKMWSAM